MIIDAPEGTGISERCAPHQRFDRTRQRCAPRLNRVALPGVSPGKFRVFAVLSGHTSNLVRFLVRLGAKTLRKSRPYFTPLTDEANPRRLALVSTTSPLSPAVGFCSRPVTLRRTVTDTRDGSSRSTEHVKRCGTRIADRCPSCSALYRGDAFQVIRSGLFDRVTNLPKLVTMITLTAPGADVFGKTHSRRISENGKTRRCACRKYHAENDRVIGTPLDPSTYNYAAAASFNANASRLFAVTMQKLSRVLRRKMEVVRVVEFQTRGLVHIHALVLGCVPKPTLRLVVRGGINPRTGRQIAAASSGGWTWGPQCKAEVITGDTPGKAIAYLVKVVNYSLKETGRGAARNYTHNERMTDAADKGLKCGHTFHDCTFGADHSDIITDIVNTVTGEINCVTVRVNYQGPGTKSRVCRRHRRAEEGWGFRGHVLSKSRTWGCTFREVRARREMWVNAKKPTLPPYLVVSWERLRDTPRLPTSLATSGVSPP